MSAHAEFIKAIKNAIPKSFIGIVNSVNEDNYTCDVDPVGGGAKFYDIRLKAVVDFEDVSIIVIPEVGSSVVCSPIEHNSNTLFISLFGRIKRVSIKVSSGGSMAIEADGTVKLNGDSFSGLVKSDELKSQLDKTNAVVNAIVEALTSWVVAPSDGGAALKVFATALLAGKVTGDYSDIKNEAVQHGSI